MTIHAKQSELVAEGIHIDFRIGGSLFSPKMLRAVSDVSFTLKAGEALAIVGESGSGKSTVARALCRVHRPTSGDVVLDGENILSHPKWSRQRDFAQAVQMIFQDPFSSLNPVHTIGKQLTEVLLLHKDISAQEAIKQSVDVLDRVGIPSPDIRMLEYPHQLSGGMRQRVVIAIALACKPSLLIADEPTTALDVTIQAQILELIKELQTEMGMSVILITHDLGVIAEVCQQVVVMYAGKVAEKGSVFDLFDNPQHPYTRGLLESIPRLDSIPKSKLNTIEGMVPGLLDLPAGCRFANRCPIVDEQCKTSPPLIEHVGESHQVSCFRWQKS